MRPSEQRSRIAGVALSLALDSAVAIWALENASAPLAPAVAMVGIAGVITLAAALTVPLAPIRSRTITTGLVLVGTASVVGATTQPATTRSVVLAISGALLFCATEFADRSLAHKRAVKHMPGVERWSPRLVLGVAVGSAGLACGATWTRGSLAGGGPAALAAGTVAATLVAFLVALLLRTRARTGT